MTLVIAWRTTKLIEGGYRGLQAYRPICYYFYVFYVFYVFQNPKKTWLFTFFCSVSYVFSNYGWMSAAFSVFKPECSKCPRPPAAASYMIEHLFSIQSWARAAVWAGAPSCWKMKLSDRRCLRSLTKFGMQQLGDIVTGVHFSLFVHKVKFNNYYQRGYLLCQNRGLITCSLSKIHI